MEELKNTGCDEITLVDFGAPWCAPCSLQEPIIRELADKFSGKASIAEVDIDKNQDMVSILRIQSIPTLILFKKGKEIKRFTGLQSEKTLSYVLRRLIK
ncbi:MAG: thioredoxin family protein [Deltaproteobacteria bacterium]|nr:thioredoxin family protein [Deltaproteobacteria bacterium]